MRDILLAFIFLYCSVVALKKPYLGLLCWTWISLMSPHRLAYGFMHNQPVALLIFIATITGVLFEKHKEKVFQHKIVYLQIVFLFWTVITTIFALYIDPSLDGLNRFYKIFLGVVLSYVLVNSREKLDWLVWTVFLSVGYYGIKGGVYTLRTAGGGRVWGPPGSFIEDNNHLACALLMILPLGSYLISITNNGKVKKLLGIAMALIGVSVLGSNSRGAFVGMLAVFLFWMRNAPGKQKIMVMFMAFFVGTVALTMMPQSYWDRMNTVKTYEKDGSAMGRINAWWCAFNLANDRVTGAGYNYASRFVFSQYAPNPTDLHTAHSIYFQVLGDHGWIGLVIFLLILILTWWLLGKIIRNTRSYAELKWANQLARMIQLSLISYMVAGAFLSLPYYDLYWDLVAITVILNTLVCKQLESNSPGVPIKAKNTSENNGCNRYIRSPIK